MIRKVFDFLTCRMFVKQKIDAANEDHVAPLRIRTPLAVHCGSCEDFTVLQPKEEKPTESPELWTCDTCLA